jgi:hypothetical protein
VKIKKLVGDRPFGLSEEDYQNILEAREGDIFYLTEPEITEVMERQAKARLTKVAEIGEMQIFEATGTIDEDVMKQLEQKLRNLGKN